MPEATIHEEGQAPRREEEIRAHPPTRAVAPTATQRPLPAPARVSLGPEDLGERDLGGNVAAPRTFAMSALRAAGLSRSVIS